MPQLIVRYGLHRRRNLEQIEEAWKQAVGEPFDAVTQVTGLHRGTLTVKVPHNGFMLELSFRQSELKDTLNTLLQDEKIRKIRFEV
jgi:predicted nucleic acid-binding Zn ribbon protein